MKIKVTKCDNYRWWYADMVGNIINSTGEFIPWMDGIGLLVSKYHNVIKEGNYEIVNDLPIQTIDTLITPATVEGDLIIKLATKINEIIDYINNQEVK